MTKIMLVDTTSRTLNVAMYLATKTAANQLVLRHVGNLGPLMQLKKFNTGDYFVATTIANYDARSSYGKTRTYTGIAPSRATVAARLEERSWDKRPFMVSVYPNNAYYYNPIQSCGLSEDMAAAAMEMATMKADQGHLVIGEGQSNYFRYGEFIPGKGGQGFNMAAVPEEYQEHISALPEVLWLWQDGVPRYYRVSDVVEFTPEWVDSMLISLEGVEYKNALLPTAGGTWAETMMYLGSGFYSICPVEETGAIPFAICAPLLKEWQAQGNDFIPCANKEFWQWALPKLRDRLPCRAVYNGKVQGELVG